MVSGLRLLTYALFRLAFTSAPRFPLNLASTLNSPVHSSIGTPSLSYGASTACRHTVSGSFSLRSPGSFHLSLTVLSAIGRSVVFSLGWWSTLLPTRFLVSRGTLDPCPLDALSGTRVSLSLPQFPICFPLRVFLFCRSATPIARGLLVWALPVSLAATWGISCAPLMNLLANLFVWAFLRFVVIACHSHRYDALFRLAQKIPSCAAFSSPFMGGTLLISFPPVT